MKVIGVTGGVGAGKSEVLGYIAEHWNATVVEADEVGYLVMRPGKACYSAIVDLFGTEIVKEDQTLDRELIARNACEDEWNCSPGSERIYQKSNKTRRRE